MTLAAMISTLVGLLPLPPQVPDRGTTPPAATADRHRTPTAGPAGRDGASVPGDRRWVPPLTGPLEVITPFRPPPTDWLPGHRGVDLGAEPGADVLAAGVGVVLWAGAIAGRGVVSVLHGDGRRTTYEPVSATVRVGDLVDPGDLLGQIAVGASHCGGIPSCLHWGLISGETYLDPMSLLAPARHPRLLPVTASAP